MTLVEGGAAPGADPEGKEDCPAQTVPEQQVASEKASWQLHHTFLWLP